MHAKQLRRAESLFWLCIGAAICVLAWKTRVGSFHQPGPGFVALFVGFFLVGASLVMGLSAFRPEEGEQTDVWAGFQGISWFRLWYTVLLLFAYALVINALGYVVATFLLMWGLFAGGEKKRWAFGLLASVITTAASYLVFETCLGCQLPRGIFAW